MNKLALVPVPFALLLASCGPPETITAGKPSDPDAAKVKAAPTVKLPPALLASKTYRCKDNSLVYVDFFNDGMTANLRTAKGGMPTALTAPEKGKPYAGEGYMVTGTAEAKTVSIARPGKGAQDCDA